MRRAPPARHWTGSPRSPPTSSSWLFLAEKTVKNYVSSIFAKLGLERRAQAAVLANRLEQDERRQH